MQPGKEVPTEAFEKLQEIFDLPFLPTRGPNPTRRLRRPANTKLPWATTLLFVLVIGAHVADVKDQAA